jgi:LmbE family N-acetylglucosaminyl deacetylase
MATVLGIWAHPDDEVFVSGGFMADAVRKGDRVVCLHMTRGEAGLNYRQPCTPEILSSIRERELKASLECLGVEEQRFLTYPDGGLSLIPSVEGVAGIHAALTDTQPDVIVTFGSDGFTGHPDHKTLSSWVTTAARLWDKPKARILHATVSNQWKKAFVPRLNEFDFFWPNHPVVTARCDMSLHLDEELLDAKVAALGEHASQMQPLFDSYGEDVMRAMAASENFRLGPRAAFRSRMLSELQIA